MRLHHLHVGQPRLQLQELHRLLKRLLHRVGVGVQPQGDVLVGSTEVVQVLVPQRKPGLDVLLGVIMARVQPAGGGDEAAPVGAASL